MFFVPIKFCISAGFYNLCSDLEPKPVVSGKIGVLLWTQRANNPNNVAIKDNSALKSREVLDKAGVPVLISSGVCYFRKTIVSKWVENIEIAV